MTGPGVRARGAPSHRLPLQPTPLVDREDETRAVRDRLLRDRARLLTLVGPGGVGKTRLALTVADRVLGAFADGVFFVDLSALRDPTLVLPTIGRVLGVPESGERSPLAQVAHHLRHRRTLLVLDNCEQVRDAAPDLADLLAACADVAVLATSREPLGLVVETLHPVPPLPVPASAASASSAPSRPMQVPAVELFVQRARAADPGYALAEPEVPTVAEICLRLDGLPLAIELAAGRVRALPPSLLLERLSQRLDLLSGGALDAPARHQTLRAALAWSYDLLNADEQALFRRLAVFAGGCTREAVEAVCNPDGALSVQAGLASLVDKHLLRREREAAGGVRYTLLETIRAYAAEQLEASGEGRALRRRHATYVRDLAQDALPHWWGPREAEWVARLDHEVDNVRAALTWSLSSEGEPAIGLQLLGGAWRFWDRRGYLREGRAWLERVLAACPDRTPDRVRALDELSSLAFALEDIPTAVATVQEALPVARSSGDAPALALALSGTGAVTLLGGNPTAAEPLLEEGITVAREAGYGPATGWNLFWRGQAALAQGHLDRAMTQFVEAADAAKVQGDQFFAASAQEAQAQIALLQGEIARASTLQREALERYTELGHEWSVGRALVGTAAVALAEGDPARAARLLGASEALRERIGALRAAWLTADYDRLVDGVRAALGENELHAAWAEGRALATDVAVAYALEGSAPAAPPAVSLSPREQEVAALVAQGLSNKQIAGVLTIAESTAERHVANILAKLRGNSRAQIAAWAVAHGLGGTAPQ